MKGTENPQKTVSPETRRRISEARTGRPIAPHSQEQRARMREAHLGKTHSQETKQKISEALKGRVISDEWKRKISEAKKDRKRTGFQRGKHPNAKRVRQLTLEGDLVREWDSMRDIADDPRFPSAHKLSDCCRGLREAYNGYRWEYADKDRN